MHKTLWASFKAFALREPPESLTIAIAAVLVPGAALLSVFALLWLIAGEWREAIATGTIAVVAVCLVVALWGGVFVSGRTLGGSLGLLSLAVSLSSLFVDEDGFGEPDLGLATPLLIIFVLSILLAVLAIWRSAKEAASP